MARPNKFNLQYFPLDIDFFDDHKLISIEETAGIKGGYIALRIIAMTYADNGYYMEWPEKFECTIAKRIGNGITSALVMEVFKLCLKYDLFDKKSFEKHGIVTSRGIQKRWREVMHLLRRKVIINDQYWLVSSEETTVNDEETPSPGTFSTQKEMKGNEIKGDEIKEKKKVAPKAPDDPDFSFNLIKEKFTVQFFPTWQRWKEYKLKEFKFKFKSQESETASATELFNLAEGKEITAGAIIQQSMANGWKGFFDLKTNHDQPAAGQKNGTPAPPIADPGRKMKLELEYLYGRFLEDQCTVISIEVYHYDFLKRMGMVSFTPEQAISIRQIAVNHIDEKKMEPSEKTSLTFMKKFGVLELFKRYQSQNKTTVFDEKKPV